MAHKHPLWTQSNTYPAGLDRLLLGAIWPGGGGAGAKPAAVSNTPNVSIPPGWLAVPLASGQGSAVCSWDAADTVPITTEQSGSQRWDAVVCQVRDPDLDGGANSDFIFAVVKGVPATSSPAIPATPANSALVCLVLVTGGQANLNTATLLDRRPLGHCEVHLGAATALPNTAFAQLFFDTVDAGAGWNFGAYTCPAPGIYRVTATMTVDRALTFSGLQVKRAGVVAANGPVISTSWAGPVCAMAADIYGCAAGDPLTVWGLVGPAANTAPGAANTFASFRYLGPT